MGAYLRKPAAMAESIDEQGDGGTRTEAQMVLAVAPSSQQMNNREEQKTVANSEEEEHKLNEGEKNEQMLDEGEKNEQVIDGEEKEDTGEKEEESRRKYRMERKKGEC